LCAKFPRCFSGSLEVAEGTVKGTILGGAAAFAAVLFCRRQEGDRGLVFGMQSLGVRRDTEPDRGSYAGAFCFM